MASFGRHVYDVEGLLSRELGTFPGSTTGFCLVWKYSDLPFESKLQETGNNSSGYVGYVQYGHSLITLS